jgi:hypothetical protein
LTTIIALKNNLAGEEWPNFELYPVASQLSNEVRENLSGRPLKFNYTLFQVLKELFPGEEDYIGSF